MRKNHKLYLSVLTFMLFASGLHAAKAKVRFTSWNAVVNELHILQKKYPKHVGDLKSMQSKFEDGSAGLASMAWKFFWLPWNLQKELRRIFGTSPSSFHHFKKLAKEGNKPVTLALKKAGS